MYSTLSGSVSHNTTNPSTTNIGSTSTNSSLKDLLSFAVSGPMLLVGGGLTILGYLKLQEYITTKYKRPELYQALQNIENFKNSNLREEGCSFLLEYINNKEQLNKDSTKDAPEEKKDILYENDILRKLLNLLKLNSLQNGLQNNEELNNTEKTMQCALIIIRELIKENTGIERRKYFNQKLKNSLNLLFDLTLNENPKIVLAALRTIKSSTHFEISKKEFEDDIPNGSEGGLILLKYLNKEKLNIFIKRYQEEENTEILKGVTSLLAHLSNFEKGSNLLSEVNDTLPFMLQLLMSHIDNIRKNAIVVISNISKFNFKKHSEDLLTAFKPILQSLNNQSKVTQRIAIVEYLLNVLKYLSNNTTTIEERNKYTNILFNELKDQSEYLFRLSEIEGTSLTKQAREITSYLLNENYHSDIVQFRMMHEIVKQRIKLEQEEKTKKMVQSLRQMGIDIPPHVLSTMSQQEIQALYYQMMQQIGMM
ncbi:hypothetical protein ABK040_009028 [Willaertia magna]